jgi:hypothetical protein
MRRNFSSFLLCIIVTAACIHYAYASVPSAPGDPVKPGKSIKRIFYLGLDAGMTFYYGDLKNNNLKVPFYYRYGIQVCAERELYKATRLCINIFYGNLYGDELTANRALNFKTTLFSPQIGLSYDLMHFAKSRVSDHFSLYAFAGIECIFFNVSGDLMNKNGERYYYWTDGTIRNLPENYSNLSTAEVIKRDYHYESNYRNMDIDNAGKYSQFSFGFPLGLSAEIKIKNIGIRAGATYHFTLTDYLDNITANSVGRRAGDKKNDKFLYAYLGLFYHLPLTSIKQSYSSSCGYKKTDTGGRRKINRIN